MKKIMLIEDDKNFVDTLKEQLAERGIDLIEIEEGFKEGQAPDLEKIVQQTERKDPDYILVDLALGDTANVNPGLRLLRKLNENKRLKEKCICVISSHVSSKNYGATELRNHREQAEEYGAKKVISKEDITRDGEVIASLLLEELPGFEDETLPRVMIFEDQHGMVAEYQKIFKGKARCNFQGVTKLTEQLATTIANDYDLVIMDLRLKPEDIGKTHSGLRLIREMRSRRELADTPIVVCSKYVNPEPGDIDEETDAALAAGANATFPKTPMPTAEEFLEKKRKDRR